MPPNLYEGFSTIAATIVQQLDGALNDGTGFEVRTLAEFALILAVITLLPMWRPGCWSAKWLRPPCL